MTSDDDRTRGGASGIGVWGRSPHATNRTEAAAIALNQHLLKI